MRLARARWALRTRLKKLAAEWSSIELGRFGWIGFGWKRNAGLIHIAYREWGVHLLVQPKHWLWGHEKDWYDGPIDLWGGGPFFLVTKFWEG